MLSRQVIKKILTVLHEFCFEVTRSYGINNMAIEHEINRFNEKRNPRQTPLPTGHVQSHRGKIHTESI